MATQIEQREEEAMAYFDEAQRTITEGDIVTGVMLLRNSIKCFLVNITALRLREGSRFDEALMSSNASEYQGYRSLLHGAVSLGAMDLIQEYRLENLALALEKAR